MRIFAIFGICALLQLSVGSARAQTSRPSVQSPPLVMPNPGLKRQLASSARPPQVVQPAPRSALNALALRLPRFALDEVPLRDAFDRLAEAGHCNLVTRWNIIKAAGINPDHEVTLRLRDVTFDTALRILMREAESRDVPLAFEASDEMIVVSTRADFESRVLVKTYYIADLALWVSMCPVNDPNEPQMYFPQGEAFDRALRARWDRGERLMRERPDLHGAVGTFELAELIDSIKATVEPESWDINGGPGSIAVQSDYLIVRANPFVHQRLGGYLRVSEAQGAQPARPPRSSNLPAKVVK